MTRDEQVTPADADAGDIAAIRHIVAEAGRHQNDPDRLVALHTADTIIVNIAGRRVLGGDAFHAAMTRALESPLARVFTRVDIEDIRFATPDVAIVSCRKHVSDQRDDAIRETGGLPSQGSLTYVIVRTQGAWRIALAQTTPVLNG